MPREATPGDAFIDAQRWSWRHATSSKSAPTELTLTINYGERVLLLGPSGSGKSTLLKAIAGLLDPEEGEESGSLVVDGESGQTRTSTIGYVQQDPESNLVLPYVGDDVAFGCENLGIPRDAIWPRVASALDAVGLAAYQRKRSSELSGGQQQRLAVASALAMGPSPHDSYYRDAQRVLLLDEPTANIDPEGIETVRDAVVSAMTNPTSTLILIEHNLDAWVDVVERAVVLDAQGRLIADGPPTQVFSRHRGELEAAGVWVPDDRRVGSSGSPLRASEASPYDRKLVGDGQALLAEEVTWIHPRMQQSSNRSILWTEDLVVGYPNWRLEPGLDLTFLAGVSTAITGANGTGKTTLALTLAGLQAPQSGRVHVASSMHPPRPPHLRRRQAKTWNASDPHTWPAVDLLPRLGMVFQEPAHQFVAPTVVEELAIGMRLRGWDTAHIDERVRTLLERLHLEDESHKSPFSLSGGQKRRLSVGTAIATQPDIVILDEPTFGQDRKTWFDLVHLIEELVANGTTVISVSHDLPFVKRTAQVRIELRHDE